MGLSKSSESSNFAQSKGHWVFIVRKSAEVIKQVCLNKDASKGRDKDRIAEI